MKNVHVGMFIEINKDRLSITDMSHAINALEHSSDDKVYSLLDRNTKNPKVTSFLALFFGWLGLDCFYLGDIIGGFGRILLTALCVALGFCCHNFIDLVTPILDEKLLPYVGYAQAIIAIITASVYPIYVALLIKHAVTKAHKLTLEKNVKIFNLRCKEYQWSMK